MKRFTFLYDDEGEEIYSDYIVKIHNKDETKTPYDSVVYFGADGAQVLSHPIHTALGIGTFENLSRFCDYGCGDEYKMGIVSCKIIGELKNGTIILR